MTVLERAIFDTVQWYDVMGMPVTVTQLTERLVVERTGRLLTSPVWEEVRRVLSQSVWLRDRLDEKWGYVFLKGKEHTVRDRLVRHAHAQQKWKVLRRVASYLAWCPFVRGLAGSGSLAIDNTKEGSDLDVLVIVARRRMWLTRLMLVAVAELSGRRRRHWDTQAPDKVCLNHYLREDALAIDPEIRNLYTAVLYRSLVPLYGGQVWEQFERENEDWLRNFVWQAASLTGLHRYRLEQPVGLAGLKRQAEAVLAEPLWDFLETGARWLQLFFIRRHQQGRQGRIVVSDVELAFHPDTKAPALVRKFQAAP